MRDKVTKSPTAKESGPAPWREGAPLGEAALARACAALAEGGVLAYPTETSYALGGNALLPGVVEAVYRLKQRPVEKSLLLLIGGVEAVARWCGEPPPGAGELMRRFWPGPLTLVLPAGPALPAHLPDARGTIALRWSPHPLLATLFTRWEGPLIGTSANPSGEPPAQDADAVLRYFPHGMTGVLDGGVLPAGQGLSNSTAGGVLPSTIVDTTTTPMRVLRAGAVDAALLREVVPELAAPPPPTP